MGATTREMSPMWTVAAGRAEVASPPYPLAGVWWRRGRDEFAVAPRELPPTDPLRTIVVQAAASREGRWRRLELCAGKLARTVLRGREWCKPLPLPDRRR